MSRVSWLNGVDGVAGNVFFNEVERRAVSYRGDRLHNASVGILLLIDTCRLSSTSPFDFPTWRGLMDLAEERKIFITEALFRLRIPRRSSLEARRTYAPRSRDNDITYFPFCGSGPLSEVGAVMIPKARLVLPQPGLA
jgi:hypothetical protein